MAPCRRCGESVTNATPRNRLASKRLQPPRDFRGTATVARDTEYQWGTAHWDLDALSYVEGREYVAKVQRAFKPGGMVLGRRSTERDGWGSAIGGSVVFDSSEILQLFPGFRVLQYEDAEAVADFGRGTTRVVRLAAPKPGAR